MFQIFCKIKALFLPQKVLYTFLKKSSKIIPKKLPTLCRYNNAMRSSADNAE